MRETAPHCATAKFFSFAPFAKRSLQSGVNNSHDIRAPALVVGTARCLQPRRRLFLQIRSAGWKRASRKVEKAQTHAINKTSRHETTRGVDLRRECQGTINSSISLPEQPSKTMSQFPKSQFQKHRDTVIIGNLRKVTRSIMRLDLQSFKISNRANAPEKPKSDQHSYLNN